MFIAAFALGALVAQAGASTSKADVVEAHRRFERGTELYEENNLAGALVEFRRAYALSPNYKVLYNIGQICLLMQDNPCAYSAFSGYLDQGGGELPARRREDVQRDLARLQARVARLRIIVDKPGAEVTVDDASVGTTPLGDPVLVNAGRPRVRVELAGYPTASRVVEVAGMETAVVRIRLSTVEAESVAAAVRPPEVRVGVTAPSHGLRTTGIVVGVAGLAAIGGGVFASLKVKQLAREIDNAGVGELDAAKLASQNDKASRYQTLQWVGYGVGGAAVATAIILTMMDGDAKPAEARLRVVPSVGAGGTPQIALARRF